MRRANVSTLRSAADDPSPTARWQGGSAHAEPGTASRPRIVPRLPGTLRSMLVAPLVLGIAAVAYSAVVIATPPSAKGCSDPVSAVSGGVPVIPCSSNPAACGVFNCTQCIGEFECVLSQRTGLACSPCAPFADDSDLAAALLFIGALTVAGGLALCCCICARNGFDPSSCKSNNRHGCTAICSSPFCDPWPQAPDCSTDGTASGPGYAVGGREVAPSVVVPRSGAHG